jgi:hypothetical protein
MNPILSILKVLTFILVIVCFLFPAVDYSMRLATVRLSDLGSIFTYVYVLVATSHFFAAIILFVRVSPIAKRLTTALEHEASATRNDATNDRIAEQSEDATLQHQFARRTIARRMPRQFVLDDAQIASGNTSAARLQPPMRPPAFQQQQPQHHQMQTMPPPSMPPSMPQQHPFSQQAFPPQTMPQQLRVIGAPADLFSPAAPPTQMI